MYSETSHTWGHTGPMFFRHLKKNTRTCNHSSGNKLLCLEAEGKKPSHKHLHQDIYTGTRPSGQVVSYVNLMALWVVLQNYLGLQ